MHTLDTVIAPLSKCPFPHQSPCNTASMRPAAKRKSDDEVLSEVHEWMAKHLPCVAGRREYNRGRYMIELATRETVATIFDDYKSRLAKGEVVACLFVFNEERFYQGQSDTGSAFKFLAEQMEPLSSVSAHKLAHGASLTNSVELRCPVTNKLSVFDDFECIAFCPQSDDKTDPLYDPLMAMPYPAVNLSSDVFAFSTFVSDSAANALGCPVHEEKDQGKIADIFRKCVERWQRVATATIRNYEDKTDTSLCPVHVTHDEKYWIAAHKDPAFAEQIKETHKHELPTLYGTRIARQWLDYFRNGQTYRATGLARDGIKVN